MSRAPTRSPFKFLDAYNREERSIFFGRDKEIEDLFELVRLSKLVLVYGLSGTGKTSLVNCGLASKFSENKWFPIKVRRGDNFLDSIYEELNRKMEAPIPRDLPLPEALQAVYLQHFVPVYLILDQFEELFILGSVSEQEDFFESLAALFHSQVACRTTLVLREEYLPWFSNFEKTLPVLFDNRFRVEKMRDSQLEEVIQGTLTAPRYGIEWHDPAGTVPLLLGNLRDDRNEIDLTNLQIYLDRLWDKERERNPRRTAPLFDQALVEEVGKLKGVLSRFLDEILAEAGASLGKDRLHVPLDVLTAFVTNEGTKQSRALGDLYRQLSSEKSITPREAAACVEDFAGLRILRPLKAGDKTLYELAHDLLAGLVFDLFSAEEKARRKAKDVFAFYTEVGNWRLFTKEELETLTPYLQVLSPENDLAAFIANSRNALKKEEERALESERRKRRRATVIAVIGFLLAAAAAVAGLYAMRQSQLARSSAYNAQISSAGFLKSEGKFEDALAGILKARENADDKQKTQLDSMEAEWALAYQLSEEADTLYKNDLKGSLDKYQEALAASRDKRLQGKVEALEKEVNIEFDKALAAGDAMRKANQLCYALQFYKKAEKLKPEDLAVKARIKSLKNQ